MKVGLGVCLANLPFAFLAGFFAWLGVGLIGDHNAAGWVLIVMGVSLPLLVGAYSISSQRDP